MITPPYSFCTLFDSNYLYFGLLLYQSLVKHSPPFHLTVLAMDPLTQELLEKENFPHVSVISLEQLTNHFQTHHSSLALSQRFADMTVGQVCWSCQPLLIQMILEKSPELSHCTYLEADSYFFSSPEAIFAELGPGNVTLVPHRYLPNFDYQNSSGIYCVQFNCFRNNLESKEVLKYWRDHCLLYHKDKPDTYPGQTCLDSLPMQFSSVKVVEHIGAGLAPWNASRYKLTAEPHLTLNQSWPVIFYHFHDLALLNNREGAAGESTAEQQKWDLGSYPLNQEIIEFIYRPYLQHYAQVRSQWQAKHPNFCFEKKKQSPPKLKDFFTNPSWSCLRKLLSPYRRKLKGIYNTYSLQQ